MNVMGIGIETFQKVNQKAQAYKFNKQVDINYCENLRKMTENSIERWIMNLARLNELTYCERNDEQPIPPEDSYETLDLHRAGKNINTYQMLKYLQAIDYNTEFEAARNNTQIEAKQLLQNVIEELKDRIIIETGEYQNAKLSLQELKNKKRELEKKRGKTRGHTKREQIDINIFAIKNEIKSRKNE